MASLTFAEAKVVAPPILPTTTRTRRTIRPRRPPNVYKFKRPPLREGPNSQLLCVDLAAQHENLSPFPQLIISKSCPIYLQIM